MKKTLLSSILLFTLCFCPLLVTAAMNSQNGLTNPRVHLTDIQKAGRILQILADIDNYEIDAAKQALDKSSNPDVKDFAQTMLKAHSRNLEEVKALSNKINVNLAPSNKAKLLMRKGKKQLEVLASKNGKEFDVAYINDMVTGHTKALKLINDRLLPNASNKEVIKYLNATKDVVAHHLQMAEEVQKKL